MKHLATPRFWSCYRVLPDEIQRIADQCYKLLCENPRHPSLHFKKTGQFWSARVGLHYRAIAVEDNQDLLWVWIGTHAQYDLILRRS